MRISDWSSDVCSSDLLPVKARLLVTDLAHRFANRRLDFIERARRPGVVLEHALAADFAREHDELRRRQRFACDARFGILRQEQVDDRIRNLVGALVGMPLRHAFGGAKKAVAHGKAFSPSNIKDALCTRAVSAPRAGTQ